MHIIGLEYHDVLDGATDASGFAGAAAESYKLSAPSFLKHLDAVGSAGRPVVAVRDRAAINGVIVLTFDDGGTSALSNIGPALSARRWTGHFFIASDCLGRPGFLDAHGLRRLAEMGHVVGSHSCSHPLRMDALSERELLREWRDSKAKLEDVVGRELPVASVPGGGLSRRVVTAAAESGIRVLFTSEPESRVRDAHGCLLIGRFTLRSHHEASYVASLCGPRGWTRGRQWIGWNIRKALKRAGGPAYLRVRKALYGDAT